MERIANLEWTRPLALWSLLVPILVWLLSLHRDRPQPVATGTFALWEAAKVRSAPARRGAGDLARVLWAAALLATALAFAGPRLRSAAPRPVLRIVVDRSPSMLLPHTLADGTPSGRGTRLEAALAELHERFPEGSVHREWLDRSQVLARRELAEASALGQAVDTAFPAAWMGEPSTASAVQPWESFDQAGILWLTDDLVVRPARAGLLAVGGGQVYGPAAREGTTRFDWDGEGLHPSDVPAEPHIIEVRGWLPSALEAFVPAWAEARGHRMRSAGTQEASQDASLVLHGHAPSGDPGAPRGRVGRDGWSVAGELSPVPPGLPLPPGPPGPPGSPGSTGSTGSTGPVSHAGRSLSIWLAGEFPVVAFARGDVFLGLPEATIQGDRAAFAVSFADLFDAALRPDPQVVPIAERGAASPGFMPPELDAPEPETRHFAAYLAGLAVILGLCAVWLAGRGGRVGLR